MFGPKKKQDLFWISDHFKVEIPNSKYIVRLIIWPKVHEQQKKSVPLRESGNDI